ncbi:MAG: hypothetical protein ABUL72_06550 [Armatimonadota bacterium]
MSATASFIKVAASSLSNLAKNFSMKAGQEVAVYPFSGYVIGTVLPYLEENGFDLMASGRESDEEALGEASGSSVFILTPGIKADVLTKLSHFKPTASSLASYYNEFNDAEEEVEAIAPAMEAAIECLKTSLVAIDDDSVVLVVVG